MTRKWCCALLSVALLGALSWLYIGTHPLVFLKGHQHCIKFAGLSLEYFAKEHDGKFPFHTKGYPNALLMLDEDRFYSLTGPGYDAASLYDAKRLPRDLTEQECGRVYIQGLTKESNPEIVLLFDKLPTPGGDHCQLPLRLWAPLGREVWTVGTLDHFVEERDWPEFVKKQVKLLMKEGFDQNEAERLFAFEPK